MTMTQQERSIAPELRERIFALYWGHAWETPNSIGQICHRLFEHWDYYRDKASIPLKTLSSITDEDAYEVGKLVNCWSKSERKMKFFVDDEMKEVHVMGGQAFAKSIGKEWGQGLSHPFANSTTDILNAYDKLRELGYALPAMGYSIEELAQAGIFKIKEA